ncbi:cytochrome d ubiquinol oxidase subunit II [Rhodoferax sp. U11-2br]|uniref:cytochrome d ubiquinol oxidase subunit II n=1 Tax=Rhodoferax sp. U11-2br TaxID=2838878 RepID=UPI001BE76602|nr:cytochrome d ubiquinol oxidase subunit II [Rhodoferax sp. U11-2br]MBT3066307.1 cytochrome d ubiquinol oxidase subunit II [Rhodoferax sp. U11-2br]
MFDYAILKLVWWLLVCVLLIGFSIMDGHDMGVGALLPFVGKTDDERRVLLNTVGPHWEGNQVWFITAGGAIFAAWPLVYATAFSGFYFALMAVLWALFFRPVGFEYRSKVPNARWRSAWDWGLFVGGAVPALVFGVAIGNIITGVPFHFEDNMMPVYTGSFWALFTPFSLLCGVASLTLLLFHGANYLQLRTEGVLAERSRQAALGAGVVLLLMFSLGGVLVANMLGYQITSTVVPGEAVSPVGKTVVLQIGAWMGNYAAYPLTWALTVLAYVGIVLGLLAAFVRKPGLAFIASGLACAGVILTAGAAIFPFVLPSSTHPGHSLTVWDCVSSQRTLNIMFWVALVMTPIILVYTSWAYRLMRGKITVAQIQASGKSLY